MGVELPAVLLLLATAGMVSPWLPGHARAAGRQPARVEAAREPVGAILRHAAGLAPAADAPPTPARDLAATVWANAAHGAGKLTDASFTAQPSAANLLGAGMTAAALAAAAWVFLQRRHAADRERRAAERDRKYADALELLARTTASISARLGTGAEMLDELCEAGAALAGVPLAAIGLLEPPPETPGVGPIGAPDGPGIRFVAAHGTRRWEHLVRPDDGAAPLTWQCVRDGTLVVVADAAALPPAAAAPMASAGMRSALFVPLRGADGVVGVFLLADRVSREFDPREVRLAQTLGAQAGVAVSNARLFERTAEALRVERDLLQQRDKLAAVTTAVYRAATLAESIDRIVELAPAALGVDVCVVDLVSPQHPGRLDVAGATKPFDGVAGFAMPLAGSDAERAIAGGVLTVVEDARGGHAPSVDPRFAETFRAGAVVRVPMFGSDTKPIGVISLVRHEPGPVTEDQRRLANVFADRAAGAIEGTRLFEQTTRDAEAKAMLLREVHHRVKNNLAGIVALLSTHRPPMPAEAEQWLARAVGRISVMARAHELFTGGMETVGLHDLVAQMLPTLSVLKPPGVAVRTELAGGLDVPLPTERAVSLAMVLHELCCNALTHGVGQAGSVVIRARPAAGGGAVIEVVDNGRRADAGKPDPDGSLGGGGGGSRGGYHFDGGRDGDGVAVGGAAAARQAPPGTGLGLRLVSGLVSRELGGRFSITPAPGGGTVATIHLPAGAEPAGGGASVVGGEV